MASRTPSAANQMDTEEPNSGSTGSAAARRGDSFFYSEAEAAARLGLHRTTLRALALAGLAPVEPVAITPHRRVYRRIDIHRLAGIES